MPHHGPDLLKPAKQLTEEGRTGGRTTNRQQPDIGGYQNGCLAKLDEIPQRQRPHHGNCRVRTMNLPMREQSDRAHMVPVRRVRMDQGMQAGENHHRLEQQENPKREGRAGLFSLP